MNKKTKIQIAIIVVMFSSSGLVLYLGFGRQVSAPVPIVGIGSPISPVLPSGGEALLPHGDKLEFGAINESRFHYDTTKIAVDGDKEVGVLPEELIKPSVSQSQ